MVEDTHIGLRWEPKLFGSASFSSSTHNNNNKPQLLHRILQEPREIVNATISHSFDDKPPQSFSVCRPNSTHPKEQLKDTAGINWFDMGAPTITPELKMDLQLLRPPNEARKGGKGYSPMSLQECNSCFSNSRIIYGLRGIYPLRSVVDPKRHYKKSELKSKSLPKYFQVGTVVEPATEFYTSRLTKKERKAHFPDELISDGALCQYRKRKVREIEDKNRPAGVDKWKIRGQSSRQRAKNRRH